MKKLPAVIARVPRQADQIKELVDYCYDLDGTVLRVIDVDDSKFLNHCPKNELACRCGYSLRTVAEAMSTPFIWLEPDAIPIRTGWRQILTDEYAKSKKEFMLTNDSNPPHDWIGGIGVYGKNTRWLIPIYFETHGWDKWMIEHLKPLIHFTPLIQHSYGKYLGPTATPRRFPRDNAIIRPEAVVFHADKFHDLIPKKIKHQTFFHTGDLGDIIAALPTMKHLGGGDLVIGEFHTRGPRESMKGARFDTIKPLLEHQSYIRSVEWGEKPDGAVDFSLFRTLPRVYGESLAHWQARFLEVQPSFNPWLQAEGKGNGRVIAGRSLRYHNPSFPWPLIAEKYGATLLFVGLPEEHAEFEKLVGRKVEHAITKDLYEVAQIIEGNNLGFYNQSSPFWIAAGLGKRLVQETWAQEPNSQIIYPKAVYTEEAVDLERVIAALVRL